MAYPYRSILTPIEFDDPSLVALDVAKQIAIDKGATVHLLHVAQRLPAFGEPDVSENEHSPGEEKARAMLMEIARQHLTGAKYVIHTASSSARALAKAVVQVAAEVNAESVTLGGVTPDSCQSLSTAASSSARAGRMTASDDI
jgi:nucleotide-binding universal stress UspA family protein